jgi:serralysin
MSGTATPSTTVDRTGNANIDGLLSGVRWSATQLTYAFPTSRTDYSYDEPSASFFPVSQQQVKTALFFLEQSSGTSADDGFSLEGFTLLSLSRGSTANATLRFAGTDSANPTAYAYYPNASDTGGDIWFGDTYAGTKNDYLKPQAGNYAWHTLIHELGHALGLKHGHETDSFGALPAAKDSIEFSVMTYRGYIGADPDAGYVYGNFDGPQSFMALDIAALQTMYGADYGVMSGDTVYRWTPGSGATVIDGQTALSPGANRIFATLWDGGGNDTFDLTAYKTNLSVDLRAGGFSVFDKAQLGNLGGGPNGGLARGNIFNALLHDGNTASLIENVKAGSGNDKIVGNEVANMLYGNGGRDTLFGLAGNDILLGGEGADALDGGTGFDTASYSDAASGVTANLLKPASNKGFAAGDTYISIENLTGSAFADTLTGNGSDNVLSGGKGNDKLNGGSGADMLKGGAGSDILTGGSGADTFVFTIWTDSTIAKSQRDTITDFVGAQGDRIDLSGMDANLLLDGVQHFTYIGTQSYTNTSGELRVATLKSSTYVYGDVNGDGKADLAIYFDDRLTLEKDYFIV